jgi:hypothetical protein
LRYGIKLNTKHPDNEALLLVSSVHGLIRLNGADAAADASKATLTYSSGSVTLTVEDSITAQLPSGSFIEGIKILPNGRHLRNNLPMKIEPGTINST